MAKSQSPSVVSAAGNKVTRKEDWEEKIHVTRKRNLKRKKNAVFCYSANASTLPES